MLNDKIAVVTGASRGIGRQIALTMAKEGAAVIVNYNGSAAGAEAVVKEICEAGGQAEAVQCNVSDYAKAEEFLKYVIGKYKRIDILVNNAGITKDNLLMKMSEEEFDAVIDINLKGTFNCIKHVSRQMLKQRGGRIINISSVSGVMGNAGQANYWADQSGGKGIGQPRDYGECNCPRLYRHGDDSSASGQRKRSDGRADSVKEIWQDGRCGGYGGLSCIR